MKSTDALLDQVSSQLRSELQEAGVSTTRIEVREAPEYDAYIEVVTDSAETVSLAEAIAVEAAATLKKQGLRVRWLVRSIWSVASVRALRIPRIREDKYEDAAIFEVLLKSGHTKGKIHVVINPEALLLLRKSARNADMTKAAEPLIRRFLEIRLNASSGMNWTMDGSAETEHWINVPMMAALLQVD